MSRRGEKKVITDYWLDHYISANGVCGLCGNHGVIDTRGKVFTPAGVECGIKTYCICPNGQIMRYHGAEIGLVLK